MIHVLSHPNTLPHISAAFGSAGWKVCVNELRMSNRVNGAALLDSFAGRVIHMNPYVQQAIDVLTQAAEKLEADAKRVDLMVPKLPESEREEWKQTAKDYRKRAAEYNANIEKMKAKHRIDFIHPDDAAVQR
jgi:hypothetical protein